MMRNPFNYLQYMIETHVEGKERYQNGSRQLESYKKSENMNSIRKLKSPLCLSHLWNMWSFNAL